MILIGKKADNSILEVNGLFCDSIPPTFPAAVVKNYGLTENDYSLFHITDNSVTANRIRNGDAYSITWVNNEITGVDFTPEDSKKIIRVTSTKSSILADNTDTVGISFQIRNSADTADDLTVDGELILPIQTPNGLNYMQVILYHGAGSKQLKTNIPGEWVIPAPGVKLSSYNIEKYKVNIKSLF